MYRMTIALLLCGASTASLADELYTPFIGTYVGRAESEGLADGAEREVRDLDVTITEVDDGFRIESITVNHDGDRLSPDVSRRSSAMSFTESDIDEIFQRNFARDVFATRSDLDVVAGDPLQWARVEDDTLVVYSFVLDVEGAYELQTYRRTLNDIGMDLDFAGELDGVVKRRVVGQLIRVEDVMDDINP